MAEVAGSSAVAAEVADLHMPYLDLLGMIHGQHLIKVNNGLRCIHLMGTLAIS